MLLSALRSTFPAHRPQTEADFMTTLFGRTDSLGNSGNYLQYFLTPEVAAVFCTGESTFDLSTIDQGKIIVTTMPQKFQTERR